ncbi:MAG: alpha/beta hydrolase [Actinobacteria bacterium]|nr:alpha/beta hydrolase [Actinomycetota bacterium]
MSIEVSESRVVAGDVELAVVQAGAGGEPLLLVHGFTGSKEDFGDEMERLAARGFHVVAPDLRGHGSSDQPGDEADYSLAVFADDMWALADAVGWDRFHLLGHSMGGMIAQVMVLARPDRVHRLVLMDTHHGVVPDLDPDIIALGVHVARTEGLAVIQAVLKMGRDPLTNPAHDRVSRASGLRGVVRREDAALFGGDVRVDARPARVDRGSPRPAQRDRLPGAGDGGRVGRSLPRRVEADRRADPRRDARRAATRGPLPAVRGDRRVARIVRPVPSWHTLRSLAVADLAASGALSRRGAAHRPRRFVRR